MASRYPKLYVTRSKLKEAAESLKHTSLRLDLKTFATDAGFDRVVSIKSVEPDVFLEMKEKRRRFWFVGDAKVAANELPSHTQTATRISRYIRVFATALMLDKIHGGIIAIATDTQDAADAWRTWLNRRCRAEDIVGSDGSAPNFTIQKVKKGVYVVYW